MSFKPIKAYTTEQYQEGCRVARLKCLKLEEWYRKHRPGSNYVCTDEEWANFLHDWLDTQEPLGRADE